MSVTFEDLRDNELFSVDGVRYIKGQHPTYEPHERSEAPPNAYRPSAPHIYVRFAPTSPVRRTRRFQELRDGDRFTYGGTGYVKGRHSAYRPRDADEIPPNAHRPDAPTLYVSFGSATIVGL